jgi:hypothetical protein
MDYICSPESCTSSRVRGRRADSQRWFDRFSKFLVPFHPDGRGTAAWFLDRVLALGRAARPPLSRKDGRMSRRGVVASAKLTGILLGSGIVGAQERAIDPPKGQGK